GQGQDVAREPRRECLNKTSVALITTRGGGRSGRGPAGRAGGRWGRAARSGAGGRAGVRGGRGRGGRAGAARVLPGCRRGRVRGSGGRCRGRGARRRGTAPLRPRWRR